MAAAPSRIVDLLKQDGLSNREIRDLLNTGKVFLSGVPTADAGRLVRPDDLSIRPDAPRLVPGRDLAVIWRDEHLAVVWKPSGMLSVSAIGRNQERNVVGTVAHLFGDARPVHRIDEGTSGLLVVALTAPAQGTMRRLFARHDVERAYLALVRGPFPDEPRVFRSALVRDRGDGLRGSLPAVEDDGDEGREAITHVRLLEKLGVAASLVEARLETGRTHQVRIHLSEAGFPILGDRLYGGAAAKAAPRLALHAFVLAFRHPLTGERLSFESPLADDLEILRRDLLAPHPGRSQGRHRRR
jgi:23S rRNA pseudouridine1911/1915/1917 synthase